MFCSNCGNEVENGTKFCGICGAQVIDTSSQATSQTVPETTTQNFYEYEQPEYSEPQEIDPFRAEMLEEAAGAALKWGILSLVFAYITGFLGIIFGCIGKSKAARFQELNDGVLSGKAKVGRGLSIAGFWLGIGLTIFVVLYSFLIISLI